MISLDPVALETGHNATLAALRRDMARMLPVLDWRWLCMQHPMHNVQGFDCINLYRRIVGFGTPSFGWMSFSIYDLEALEFTFIARHHSAVRTQPQRNTSS